MKALVTGAAGFVGRYLVEYLRTIDCEVFGMQRRAPREEHFYLGDITDRSFVYSMVEELRPDLVFHLAAYSSVKGSFGEPELVHQVNVEGTRYLLDALQSFVPQVRFLYVSSAVVYGLTQKKHLTENEKVIATSPYAQSRLDTEEMLLSYQLPWIVARSFNHTGPGQASEYVLSDWCKQAAAIELGQQEPVINVGNLATIRDFIDVRDIVRMYYALVTLGNQHEIYNVGSGTGYVLGDLLNRIVSFINVPVQIEVDKHKVRSQDTAVLVANTHKLNGLFHDRLQLYSIDQTLRDVLDYWRKMLITNQKGPSI